MNRYRKLTIKSLLLFVGLTLGSTANAQTIPGFLEGPVTERRGRNAGAPNSIDGERTVRINGVVTIVSNNTPIASPTVSNLTWDDIVGANLPGRSQKGFLGGTCLCETEVDATGQHTMVQMTLEPAENVVIGRITEASCVTPACDADDENETGVLRLSGTPLDFINDPRLVSSPPTNRGFEIDLLQSIDDGNIVGAAASAEGYFGKAIGNFTESHLHLYALDIEGGTLLNAGSTEVSVERFQGRQRNGQCEYKGRGFTHDSGAGTVTISHADTDNFLFATTAVADADDATGTFGIWDDDADVIGNCAAEVRVTFDSVGGSASIVAPVDIRID